MRKINVTIDAKLRDEFDTIFKASVEEIEDTAKVWYFGIMTNPDTAEDLVVFQPDVITDVRWLVTPLAEFKSYGEITLFEHKFEKEWSWRDNP